LLHDEPDRALTITSVSHDRLYTGGSPDWQSTLSSATTEGANPSSVEIS